MARHADELEEIMSYGARISFARKEVHRRNRPTCLSCGEVIKGGAEGRANFCTKYADCRKWRRRYRTLREKYEDPIRAITEVSVEIFASKNRWNITK